METNVQSGGISYLNVPKVPLYFLFLLILLSSPCCAIDELPKVPSLDNKSIAEADYLLQNASLIATKSYCFSDSIPSHFVIPGTQDPLPGTAWYKGGKVEVTISKGKFPSVIGMTQKDAEKILTDLNLTPEVISSRNESVPQGFVFDQDPKTVGCLSLSTVKIFINAPLRIYDVSFDKSHILNDTIFVPEQVMVKGYVSSRLKKGEHLWIAVRPILSNDWWPQPFPGEIVPYDNGMLQGRVYLGGNSSDLFEIGILILDNETNEKFLEWESYSNETADWAPITAKKYGSNVTEATINRQKLASFEVKLLISRDASWRFFDAQPKNQAISLPRYSGIDTRLPGT